MSDRVAFYEKTREFLISNSLVVGLIMVLLCVILPACCMFTSMGISIIQLIERVARQGT